MKIALKKYVSSVAIVALMITLLTGCASDNSEQVIVSEDITVTEDDSVYVVTEEYSSEEEISTEDIHANMTTLTFIGHASVKIKSKDGTVIYIDPNYFLGEYSDKADYVLVTHGHDDHQPTTKLEKNENCIEITYKDALVDGEYNTFDYNDIKIEAVPAENINHDINYCVGYIITVDGITFYHAGDTSMVESMKTLADRNIDYAMYPIDGTYNMNAIEATEVANLIGAKYNIPIHELNEGDKVKSDDFTPEGRMILEYGQTIIIE